MYRRHDSPSPLLIGYDPCTDLPQDHLARLVESVVEASVVIAKEQAHPGQPQFDPRLCLKVLVYGYATGVRSSRQLEKQCRENLPYLFLTRGDTPSYRTLCSFRTESRSLLEQVWTEMFAVAQSLGMSRLGHIVVDTTKLRANAGHDMVLKQDEYADVKRELRRILDEAEAKDKSEDAEGYEGETRTGKDLANLQMRDILRAVRKKMSLSNSDSKEQPADARVKKITSRMKKRIKEAVKSIEEAESDERKHLCLTDPDARMMHGGIDKKIRECHSLELALDRECRMLVAREVTQIGNDNERLAPLVESAASNEPEGVKAVDGDSGFFNRRALNGLIDAGVDTCIPSAITAYELHNGLRIGSVAEGRHADFTYDEQNDVYRCAQGNELTRRTTPKCYDAEVVKRYKAVRSCGNCPCYDKCVVREDRKPAKSKYKSLRVTEFSDGISAAMARFNEPEHSRRYKQRGSFIESVNGFIRQTLGFDRWLLRGSDKVRSEGNLIATGYQFRTLHMQWKKAFALQ